MEQEIHKKLGLFRAGGIIPSGLVEAVCERYPLNEILTCFFREKFDSEDFRAFLELASFREKYTEVFTNANLGNLSDINRETLELLQLNAIETAGNLSLLVPFLSAKSTAVGERASALLLKSIDLGFLQESFKSLNFLTFCDPPTSEVVRIRVISLLIDLGKKDPALFSFLISNEFSKRLKSCFLTDDILFKLNAIVLFEKLASFESGRKFITSDTALLSSIQTEISEPLDESTFLASMMILAELIGPNLLKSSAEFTDKLFNELLAKHDQPSSQNYPFLIGLKILIVLSKSAIITERRNFVEIVVRKAVEASDEEVVKLGFDCLRELQVSLKLKDALEIADRTLKNKPFPAVRAHCWRLLQSLLLNESKENLEKTLLNKGAWTFKLLNDFKSEDHYDAREAKWEFVKALVKAGVGKNELGEKLYVKLCEYAKVGLGYAPMNDEDEEMKVQEMI
jgi:Proteasome non-ATPase 26S subunit